MFYRPERQEADRDSNGVSVRHKRIKFWETASAVAAGRQDTAAGYRSECKAADLSQAMEGQGQGWV